MGDVGDYWREHREYKRKEKARRIGMDAHVHAEKPITCGIDGCKKRFLTDEARDQHLRDKHKVVP